MPLPPLPLARLLALLASGAPPAPATPPDAAPPPPPQVGEPLAEERPEEPEWSGSVAATLTQTSGNSETLAAGATFDAVRRALHDRWTFRAAANYAEQETDAGEDETTADNQSASAKYDRFVSERAYWLVNALAQRDELADLDLRWSAGVGAGYQFKEEEDLKVLGELGVNYFDEDFEEEDDSYVAARAAYDVEWKPTGTTKLQQIAEAFPSLEDADDLYGRLDTRLRVSMTDSLFLQVQSVVDYDNTPAEGKERLDHRLVLALGWEF